MKKGLSIISISLFILSISSVSFSSNNSFKDAPDLTEKLIETHETMKAKVYEGKVAMEDLGENLKAKFESGKAKAEKELSQARTDLKTRFDNTVSWIKEQNQKIKDKI